MKFGKKGQGLSLNVIIIAAIVLIVLIVLWAIFTGRMGGFTSGVKECRSNYKWDKNVAPDGCPPGTVNYPGTDQDFCCVEVGGVEPSEIENRQE